MKRLLLILGLLSLASIANAQVVVEEPKVSLWDVKARVRIAVGYSREWDEKHALEPHDLVSLPISYGLTSHLGLSYNPMLDLADGKFRQTIGLRWVVYGGK